MGRLTWNHGRLLSWSAHNPQNRGMFVHSHRGFLFLGSSFLFRRRWKISSFLAQKIDPQNGAWKFGQGKSLLHQMKWRRRRKIQHPIPSLFSKNKGCTKRPLMFFFFFLIQQRALGPNLEPPTHTERHHTQMEKEPIHVGKTHKTSEKQADTHDSNTIKLILQSMNLHSR